MPKQWLYWNCLPLTLLRGRPCQGSPAYTLHCFSGGLEFLLSFSWQNVKCLGNQVFKKIKLSAFKNKLTNSRCQSQKKLFVLTSLESTRQDLELWLSTTKQGSAIELPTTFVTVWWKSCFFIDCGIMDSGINPVPDNWWYSALLLKDSSSTVEVIFWQIVSPLPSLWSLPCLRGNCRAAAVKGDPKVAVGLEML